MVVSLSGMVETGTVLWILRAAANAQTPPEEDTHITKVELKSFPVFDFLIFLFSSSTVIYCPCLSVIIVDCRVTCREDYASGVEWWFFFTTPCQSNRLHDLFCIIKHHLHHVCVCNARRSLLFDSEKKNRKTNQEFCFEALVLCRIQLRFLSRSVACVWCVCRLSIFSFWVVDFFWTLWILKVLQLSHTWPKWRLENFKRQKELRKQIWDMGPKTLSNRLQDVFSFYLRIIDREPMRQERNTFCSSTFVFQR